MTEVDSITFNHGEVSAMLRSVGEGSRDSLKFVEKLLLDKLREEEI